MLTRGQSRLLTALGAIALLLVVCNVVLYGVNRGAQAELGRQQQFIQQTVPLENLYREMVKALAEQAMGSGDRQVMDMLSAQGMSFSMHKAASAPEAAAPPKGEKADKADKAEKKK